MTIEERNKETIRRLLAAADAGDLEGVAAFYAPQYVDHDRSVARSGGGTHAEGVLAAFARFAAALPDTRHVLHDLIAEGDRVAARISAEGTHTGEGLGIPPTGRTVRSDSIVVYRLEAGRIVERWCRERGSVLEQLGLAAGASA